MVRHGDTMQAARWHLVVRTARCVSIVPRGVLSSCRGDRHGLREAEYRVTEHGLTSSEVIGEEWPDRYLSAAQP